MTDVEARSFGDVLRVGLAGVNAARAARCLVAVAALLLVLVAYVVLGAFIGSRFSGITLAALRRLALASLGAFAVVLAVAGVTGFAVAELTGEPLSQVLIAFAPGGLDAMTALAVALQMDTAYVAVHQLARFAGIALVAPVVARFYFRKGPGTVQVFLISAKASSNRSRL